MTHPCPIMVGMKAVLKSLQFHDEQEAIAYFEQIRWPDGPVCPHCGGTERTYRLNVRRAKNRPVLKCGHCRKQFTVTTGTLFERSHIPLHTWLLATHLLCCSKKGISSHQLHRMLGITYKSAWFMAHRIREAMKDPAFLGQMGGKDKVVEADETYWGNKKLQKGESGYDKKEKIFSLVERGGKVRSFHVDRVDVKTLTPILKEMVHPDTHLMTDEHGAYRKLHHDFPNHGVINHSQKEYSRGLRGTNTVEGYFSLLKRGLIGTYHHVGHNHLKRYVGEFDFRYNHREIEDSIRTDKALAGADGKRLRYKKDLVKTA